MKWVGGKTRLLETLAEFIPDDFETYYEPFLGGGSLYFHLQAQGRFRRAVLNDCNPELINCYRVLRDLPSYLIEQLGSLTVSKEVFLQLRDIDPASLGSVPRAARMIYLNKTAFNGLHRVNKRGQFNAPWGKYEDPKVLDVDNLTLCSFALNRETTLLEGDFLAAVEGARAGDVVYFDPPYVPLSQTSNFTSYAKDGFTLDDHRRLATRVRELASQGVFVVVSNSDTPMVRELYEGFEIHVVRMRRNVSSDGEGRGPVNEVLVLARAPETLDP